VGRCTQRIAIFDHGFNEALVDSLWAVSLLFCTVRLRKQSFCLVVPPFLALKVFHSLYRQSLTEGTDYGQLINDWVWLESQICTA